MRIVSESECRSWLSDKLQDIRRWTAAKGRYTCSITYRVPVDAGRKTALARTLAELISARGEGLLWVTGWGVFPSSENMSLFDGYRRSLHDERSLYMAPGHVFEREDRVHVECLLDLVLYFSWDASVFDAGTTWLRISHDEFFSVNAVNKAVLMRWREAFDDFELQELSMDVEAP